MENKYQGLEPLLRVDNLSINFGGLKAVDNVSLKVYPGEIVGLIGPNGAGKTTVFNLLTGVYEPSEGSIIIDGNMVLVSSDIKTRELFFYTNQNGVLLPIDDSLRKKVEETILQSDFTPSSEFKTLLDGAINNYRKYNSSNGYSNVNLEANLKHVTYYCEKDDTSRPEASYDVFNNSFRFCISHIDILLIFRTRQIRLA